MILSLLTKTEYFSLRLPERKEGRFLLRDPHDSSVLFVITGDGHSWTVRESEEGKLPKGMPVELRTGDLISVRIREGMEAAHLYAEQVSPHYAKFARCPVPDDVEYRIGCADTCDLVCDNPKIDSFHCKLICRNRVWGVEDCLSGTGTYVNGRRVAPGVHFLKPGDTVSVLNQKFILLPGLLVFNAQNMNPARLKGHFSTLKVPPIPFRRPLELEKPVAYFHRKPRYLQSIAEEDFSVNAPPASHASNGAVDNTLSMGASIVSGMAMLLGGMNPIAGIGMLASSVIFPSLNRKKGEKYRKEEEEKRQKIYQEYLDKLEQEMQELLRKQETQLRRQNPEPLATAKKILDNPSDLWGKRPEHLDFMDIRLGIGTIPAMANLSFPPETFGDEEDPMRQRLKEFQDKPRMLRDVPIVLPLSKFYSVGITGSDSMRTPFVAHILMQLAMHIGYDDLKICLIGALNRNLQPLRWLPHTWDNQHEIHLVAENKDELMRLLPVLDRMLSQHRSKTSSVEQQSQAELICLVTEPSLAHSGVLTRLLYDQSYANVHIITVSHHSAELPSRTALAIGLHDGRGRMVWQDGANRATAKFQVDSMLNRDVPRLVDLMENTFLDLRTESASMPSVLPFLNMFGVQDVTHLNILSRWESSDPISRLSTPVGISEDGDLCSLDLHEKADGPHGLIAGTTGSGKSELIMCYILSMAVSYSPEEVSFVLIDYKGGGMAQAFEHLPHTAGIITNLDGNELRRSLLSINSELQRRQRIFSDAKRQLGNLQIDIYKYQQLYRNGKVKQPVSHLLIITDEFAELKTQEPEFMQELIRAARIGRSLGVHLILATQKPAGVVDDQIWSNTNFRLCLRVQDSRDSQDVIKCPDAASLSNPGSFYKQVGYGSSMIKAQSGWGGADYTQEEEVPACGVEILDHMGSVIRQEMTPSTRNGEMSTQLQVVAEYITQLGKREKLRGRALWQPALEAQISLSALHQKYAVDVDLWRPEPVLGELDDPANQRRAVVRMPVCALKNIIVYGAIGSGKFMLLSAILEDLLLHHTAEQLHIYLLDYADDGLQVFSQAPQVGDVLNSDDDEKLLRLLSTLEMMTSQRKKKLGGAASSAPLPERLRSAGMSHVVVVLHSLSSLQERLDDNLDRLIRLMKDGPRWGITFLATQESVSGLRYQLTQRFAQQYVLQMDHNDDYSVILGRTGGLKPSPVRGRGLVIHEDLIYEFQTASADQSPKELCLALQEQWQGERAPSIRVMPDRISSDYLLPALNQSNPLRLPIGLDLETIEPVIYPFESRSVHLLLGNSLDIDTFLHEFYLLAQEAVPSVRILGFTEGYGEYTPSEGLQGLQNEIGRMFNECRRMKEENTAEKIAERERRLYLLPGLQNTLNRLDSDSGELLRAMLERARPEWRWTFLICDSVQGLSKMRYNDEDKRWFEASVSTDDGLFLGAGINRQMILQATGESRVLSQNIAFPLGYTVRNGITKRVRFMG